MPDLVHVARRDSVARVVIDHPKVNAISGAVIAQLGTALADLDADPAVRVVVIRGAGDRFFAAGADISEFAGAAETGRPAIGGIDLTVHIEGMATPVIAAVNGIAFGGGCELALACDMRLAARSARFGQPEINLGIMPGWGGTQRLPRLIGMTRAMPLLLTGDAIDAETALAWGLVSQVVELADLDAAADALGERIAAQAPLAVQAIKRAAVGGLGDTLGDGLAIEAEEFRRIFQTQDAGEGVRAFLEKRPPTFVGR